MADEVWCQVGKLDLYAHLFGISIGVIPGKEVYPGRIIMQMGLSHQMSHYYHLGYILNSGIQNERNVDIRNNGV